MEPGMVKVIESDQSVMLLIPKAKGQCFKTFKECDGFDLLEYRVLFVTPFQVIIRNARAQVMDMMKPNITREPLQNPGKFKKRTPF